MAGFVKSNTTYGGSVAIWKQVGDKLTAGAMLGVLPDEGDVLSAGTPVVVDAVGGTALPIEFYEVKTTAAAAATSLVIVAKENYPAPIATDKITVYTADGQELTVSAVGEVDSGGITLTVTALTAEVAAGTILYLSERDSVDIDISGLKGLVYNDVYIKEDTTSASISVVTEGTVYGDRIPFIPASIRTLLPNISFEGGF
jgi:hypothetical protein